MKKARSFVQALFLAKPFMKGKSLKRDFPCRWCTRKLSKVVDPLDNQRFYTLLLHSLSMPAALSLHKAAGSALCDRAA